MVHVDASLIRADVSWESLAVRHVAAVAELNSDEPPDPDEGLRCRNSKRTGKYKKVCTTNLDATMATTARNRRLEPSYKQHSIVDDVRGVVLDVEVTTGEVNEGDQFLDRLDAAAAVTGAAINVVTVNAGYAYAKIFGGLERRAISAVIPTNAEPIRSPVPMRRFRYDAEHDVLKCPRGKQLNARTKRQARPLLSLPGPRTAAAASSPPLPLEGAHQQRRSCSATSPPRSCGRADDVSAGQRPSRRLYQRHRWRSAGFHGEAKTWHGLARAVRRGLENIAHPSAADRCRHQPQAAGRSPCCFPGARPVTLPAARQPSSGFVDDQAIARPAA